MLRVIGFKPTNWRGHTPYVHNTHVLVAYLVIISIDLPVQYLYAMG